LVNVKLDIKGESEGDPYLQRGWQWLFFAANGVVTGVNKESEGRLLSGRSKNFNLTNLDCSVA
jgi:predicted glutamine amidotransferase